MGSNPADKLSVRDVLSLVHNVFLPPKLPQGEDDGAVAREAVLLTVVSDALGCFRSSVDTTAKDAIDAAQCAVRRLHSVRDDRGYINDGNLQDAFHDLARSGGVLPIHVRGQNAAIIMSREKASVVFEFFELSPRNEAAMGTTGRLRRCFPATAVSLHESTFNDDGCQASVVQAIGKMSSQEVAEMKPKVMKKGEEHIEERDTTDPAIITDFLATVLSAMGETVQTSQVWKNTREEVLWRDAKMPWRRSPLWLLLRVTLQMVLSRCAPGRTIYKEFMVFFMAQVLETAQVHDLPSDILYCMTAKISRRLLKLDRARKYSWLPMVERALSRTRSRIETRWEEAMRRSDPDLDMRPLTTLQFEEDAYASYSDLDNFIGEITSRRTIARTANFDPPWAAVKYDAPSLPRLENTSPHIESNLFSLLEFENWVACYLDLWLGSNATSEDTYEQLCNTIETYHRLALEHYSENPESISTMLLTILEMWVVCDKLACQWHHLLSEYDPGVPCEVLQSLILPLKVQMERLSRVEAYVQDRRQRAAPDRPHIFSSFGQADSFAVCYFNESLDLQSLHNRIENDARREREEKKLEFQRLQAEYHRLMALHNDSECTFQESVDRSTGHRNRYHATWCQRCRYLGSADNLSIDVHEWPLPENTQQARSVVFELQVPPIYRDWRSATTYVTIDVLKYAHDRSRGNRHEWTLEQYLPSFYRGHAGRLILVSTTKANRATHRRGKAMGTATEDDVLVRCGMTYSYYDRVSSCFASMPHATDEIHLSCTYQLSEASLQKFLFRPPHMPNGLPPNEVIAQQASCPDHLSLAEFRALTALPLGNGIQWSNILMQLHAPTVDFKNLDTVLVLLQISHQAGPPLDNDVSRAGHWQLRDEAFADKFLLGLSLAVDRIEENWESCRALGSLVSLASRLLTLAPSSASSRCLAFLEKCRAVALRWMRLLHDKTVELADDGQRMEFLVRTFEAALACASTFDVDDRQLPELFTIPSVAGIMLECSVVIQATAHSALQPHDIVLRNSVQRWRSLMYRVHRILHREIVQELNPCLDIAIANSWSAYIGGGVWKPLSSVADHWLVTMSGRDEGSLAVYFNVLTAELLVDGLPLSHLPAEFEDHPSYGTLFGRTMIRVMPTDVPGMQLSSVKLHHGYTVFFGMGDAASRDLLLTAHENDQIYDLVPSRVFSVLPESFVDDFTHWYDRQSGVIEFRPRRTPWLSSPSHWTMERADASWVLRRGDQLLMSPTSTTAQTLSQLLSPLEGQGHIHVVLNSVLREVDVDMPRLQLGFVLQLGADQLYSRQFRGMYVDPLQGIGALVGLKSKLVLRDHQNRRKVLLPDGTPVWVRSQGHIQVSIPHGTSSRVHPYDVDALLGRVVDNGNLQSKLILCYLLALTSYCLPDKLTEKTGTEESLSVLNSAAVRSFKCLSQENLDRLDSIAKLSPGRSYYPEHERVMESISWDGNLSFLSQHGDFYTSVASILDRASSTKFFYPGLYIEPRGLDHVDRQLGKRHAIRSAVFQVSGFGAEHHTSAHDVTYEGRDRLPPSLRSTRVFEVSSMIYERRQTLHHKISPGLGDEMWALLMGAEGVHGANVLSKADIGYDARWLGEAAPLLREYWCSLHHTLGGAGANRFQVMLCLATLAYAGSSDSRAIQTLAAFFNLPAGRFNVVPDPNLFVLTEGRNVDVSCLRTLITEHTLPFISCPESKLTCRSGESEREADHRRHVTFRKNQARAVEGFVNSLWDQWGCQAPQAPTSTDLETYIAVPEAMDDIRPKWAGWYQNLQFYEYLDGITMALLPYAVKSIEMPRRRTETAPPPAAREVRPFIDEQDLFQRPPPALPDVPETLSIRHLEEKSDRVALLVKRLGEQASGQHEHDYVRSLQTSLSSLRSRKAPPSISRCEKSLGEALSENLRHCRVLVNTSYQSIQAALARTGEAFTVYTEPDNSAGDVARRFMAPRVSRTFLLRQLARKHWGRHSPEWKKSVVSYGLMLTQLQRAERILSASDNEDDLLKELRNPGHTNWDPLHYPQTLLLEVEQGIMIREVQEEIALQMREPPGNANAVMQLNMGEGKSSVILPADAVHLADGTKLVQVIVGKPQANELFRTLVSKLGGLLDRQIYHMPFSRSLRLTESDARAIDILCKECMENGGVMLVQPEHLLSFQLMGIECQIAGLEKIGAILLDTQDFFDSNARQLVDEADENLIKFELIYTMGMQRPIELSPQRWMLIQRILDICRRVVPEVQEQLHRSIEVIYGGQGCFPRTRILHEDARDLLQSRIAEEICAIGLPGFPIARQPEQLRKSVLAYISRTELSVNQINAVHKSAFFTVATKGPLLLLRGLIAEGILGFALGQKRWRVNYGLSSKRRPKTRLAVPYRAKDNPTPSSEFSQPDVVIVLTCLSYYYGGLSDADLFLAFDHLVKSDQARVEYDAWVRDAPALPPSFRRLVGVNMKDRDQMLHHVFPHMRSAKSVVDYFLAHIVFPKEMKEFPQKLSASGWDIGKTKVHPTTGFSGTNDSHPLLPLAVTQLDLEEQRHTNALVLDYLLQPENSVEYVARTEGASSDAETLLNLVTSMERPVQVILDVGAQILELTNIKVAQKWLRMEQKEEAVVFFNDDDELCVIDRSERVEPFRASPYADRLDVCLIFLDEAHTRGTDLKLPKHYRAAVTLGANLTKDRLVQACMRLRRLGMGQSVVFCISEEIKSKIRAAAKIAGDSGIEVSDVLIWAISETNADLCRSMPLWAQQGARFDRQRPIWAAAAYSTGIFMSQQEAEQYLEDEAQSLERRYLPIPNDSMGDSQQRFLSDPGEGANLSAIRSRCNAFGSVHFKTSSFQEVQERERSPDIVEERQVQRPHPAEAELHSLHPHLRSFVATGTLPPESPAFMHAFQTLQNTSAAEYLDVEELPQDILTTADYMRTVKLARGNQHVDSYQRPIQWILTSTDGDRAVQRLVIISPYEAQELLPSIKKSGNVFMHLYASRSNLSFPALDALKLHTIPALDANWELPRHLRLQLNLFAGQPYFNSFSDYRETSEILGLAWKATEDGVSVQADGFIVREPGDPKTRPSTSPISFLQVLLTKIRRDGEDVGKTHWGTILGGEVMKESDLEAGASTGHSMVLPLRLAVDGGVSVAVESTKL